MIKHILTVAFAGILLSCNPSVKHNGNETEQLVPKDSLRTDLQILFDAAKVTGSILVYDAQTQISYSNNFERCNIGFLPASTFKIPNSIIALETGVVESDSAMFYWDGKKRRLPSWEKDMTFREAFHASCVPCYQEIARKIGADRMRKYLSDFDYGNMIVDSTNIDTFWLEGDSKISMRQQVNFLKRFYNNELPIRESVTATMKKLMVIDENEQYKMSGKTGWAIKNEMNIGWFVGYIEVENRIYYFATNVEPHEQFNMDMFPKIRAGITMSALRQLAFIE